jgi:serine protease
MISVNPDLTPADIDALLVRGDLSDDLGTPGRDDQYGHGIINAQRAVLAALASSGSSPADNPRLVASASALNFGGNSNSLELVLRNGGKGELELLELSVSQPWLAIAPIEVDVGGLGTYRVSVDRSELQPGVYSADIIAQSSVNGLRVRVILSVGGEGAAADVGVIYILLYDAVINEVVAQFTTAADEGNYPFEFSNIPPGQYEIVAGSDADNDLFICDPGEACGAWLTIDQPILIELESDIGNINFPIEYLVSLPSITGNTQSASGPRQALFRDGKGIAKPRRSTDD